MKYKLTLGFVHDMGSMPEIIATESSVETAEENALWEINSMRAHDNLKPWTLEDLADHSEGCWKRIETYS